ncbi:hypothetical protein F383_36160 [Gossypium arboreum]|uniref:Uncharacterized protein n=1 Tax=Gossypium arboreum TaxID=29729 RepID=A0A0B0N368_GOSAR|nr:hypothetical protein F383_36160 [Gossypium arboreum]
MFTCTWPSNGNVVIYMIALFVYGLLSF